MAYEIVVHLSVGLPLHVAAVAVLLRRTKERNGSQWVREAKARDKVKVISTKGPTSDAWQDPTAEVNPEPRNLNPSMVDQTLI